MSAYNSLLKLFLIGFLTVASAGNFYQDVKIIFGDGRAKIVDSSLVTLSLDKSSGSGFQSNNQYLFGKFEMQVKLVPGNSAGTVTSFYLQSPAEGSAWDEIDFEFLGNLSGNPYIVQTNVFFQGKGQKEQQFYLWFDPTADFHTYTILWNPRNIVFYVDGKPIREYKNMESKGVSYPKSKAMRIYSTIWDGEDWATRGGLVKTDWSAAPFTASFRNLNNANACVWSNGASSCNNSAAWISEQLNKPSLKQLQWVQKNFMVYNYCSDTRRFPQGLPPECTAAEELK